MVGLSPPSTRAAPDADRDDSAQLAELLHEVMRDALQRLHPTLARAQITMGQFWALHTLSSLEGASVSTVARYLGVSPPTVCASVDQLESAGLVARHRSERDRRAVDLSLTARGRRAEATVWREVARLMAEAADHLPADDVATTVRVVRELHRRLEPAVRGRP